MDDKQIANLVDEAVGRALGSSDKPAAAPASQPAQQAASPFDQYMQLLATEKAQELAKYKSPGAPSGAPTYDEGDPASLQHASADDIRAMQRAGTFRPALEAFRNSLDGGAPIFKQRLHK